MDFKTSRSRGSESKGRKVEVKHQEYTRAEAEAEDVVRRHQGSHHRRCVYIEVDVAT